MQQLLIADADDDLSDVYQKYFAAHGYSVRVTSGGVECLMALRETTPDVLVLDSELKWGGADGVLAVMVEEDGLSTIPVVLLNGTDGTGAGDDAPLAGPSTPSRDDVGLKWPAPISLSLRDNGPIKPPLAAQVIERLHKPFYFQNLLDSLGTAEARPS